ncbi:hypothetical protein ACTTAF_06625 [Rhodobacter capsulatus]|uniref:hypothetical protein n=1 Tax=Rhodobacter capsulatus TaxID=1061 RepID=UPI0003D2C117|nr:hypothetical protein [Rhodobacter capsulatus]ETD85718.1 hypothetical protein U703_02000 [Rhodobacter capsulatus YW1]
MTKESTRYHKVHYRRVEANDGEPSFETLCRAALEAKNAAGLALSMRPDDRVMSINDDGVDKQVLMNRVADLNSAVFGEICLVLPNDMQAMLRRSTKQVKLSEKTMATVFDLSEAQAPANSQFIRGTAYWLSVGNNLFFIQMNALSARFVQCYLEWLVKAAAESRGVRRSVASFLIEVDVSKSGDKAIGEIKNLRIKGKSEMGLAVPVAENGKPKKTSRRVKAAHKMSEVAMPLVEAILGKAWAKSLNESLGPNEYITASGEVRVSGSRTEQSREQIRKIAHEIADTTDAEVTIEGKDGRIKSGDVILRTEMPFIVPHEGGTLLDFDNVADQLQKVYGRFVEDQKIEP